MYFMVHIFLFVYRFFQFSRYQLDYTVITFSAETMNFQRFKYHCCCVGVYCFYCKCQNDSKTCEHIALNYVGVISTFASGA